MSFRHMHNEPQAERLLFVTLEGPQYSGSEFRHIRATVVRRAVPHAVNSEGVVVDWQDDHNATGYRVASWVLTKTSGTFVDDMQLRGQIDAMPKPMRNGRPYGNNIDFKPHSVCQNTARAILAFYTKYDKFVEKHNIPRRDDNFYEALCTLANFLGITKVLIQLPTVHSTSFALPHNFQEYSLAGAVEPIEAMLQPFYRPSTAEA